MFQTAREISSFRGLFRGLNLALLEVAPQTGLRFYLMIRTREALSESLHTSKSSYSAVIVSSVVGGVISQV